MVDGDDGSAEAAATESGFRALLERLRDRHNFDFGEYKPDTLVRRIKTRMGQLHVDTFERYAGYLDEHPEEHAPLFNAILINVTAFFRDPEAWAALAETVIPRLVGHAQDTRSIRVWCAGCSSGEEVYTVAILLAEHLQGRGEELQVKIYGTDLDEDALAAARHALYRIDQLKELPDRLRQRYFVQDGQLWRVRRDLRRWCIFGAQNLTQAPPLSHVDLLVCRNVLIYFGSPLQERILSRFHYALRDGGFLFLGRSEALMPRSRLFTPLLPKWRIFQRVPAAVRAAAVLPEKVPSATPVASPVLAVQSSGHAQRALEALPTAVMVIGPTDTVLAWNTAAQTLFQIPAENAVGRKFRELDVSYRVEGLRARVEEVKSRQTGFHMADVTFGRRSGEIVHANIVLSPLFDGERLAGVLVYVEDATEHARLREQMTHIAEQHATAIEELQSTNEELETTNEELQSTNEELETTIEELQAANAELAALNDELEERTRDLTRLDRYHRGVVDSIEHGLFVLDGGGLVRTWNRTAARMWEITAEQAIGRDFFALPLGEFLGRSRQAFERMRATRASQAIDEVSFTLPGSTERRGLLRLAPITDAAGELAGVVGLIWPQDGVST